MAAIGHAKRRAAMDKAWEDAVLLTIFEWTVPDPDVPGIDGERLLPQVIIEAGTALERLKAKGMLDVGGEVED